MAEPLTPEEEARIREAWDQHRESFSYDAGRWLATLDAARAAAPSGEPRRATAKGTTIDVDEWDRPLYVFDVPPASDRAGLREAIAATLESWGVGDMVRDRTPELVAELAALLSEPPLDVRADVAILLAMRGLDGPINDDWNAWERGYRSALDELLAQGRLAGTSE